MSLNPRTSDLVHREGTGTYRRYEREYEMTHVEMHDGKRITVEEFRRRELNKAKQMSNGEAFYEETNLVTDAATDREHGTVKFASKEKGFLFIIPDWPHRALQGRDVFGHISQVRNRAFNSLETGSRVSYKLARSTKEKRKANSKPSLSN